MSNSFSRTFRGGIHPSEPGAGKNATRDLPVRDMPPMDKVSISMAQHVGAPCLPTVKPREHVRMGQVVGEPRGFVGAPVHASVSGTVLALETRASASGTPATVAVIENDGKDEWHPDIAPCGNLDALSKEDMLSRIRAAGIVGLGGAGFPTQVKLSPPEAKRIDTLILNGAECEPYLTADIRLMVEDAASVALGMKLAARILGAGTCLVGIEDINPACIAAMTEACAGQRAQVVSLSAKYPQGGEKQLIETLTGRQVPSGGLPMDAGCVVINVHTAAAIANALAQGRPIVDRIVTVTGWASAPANLRARIGTPVRALIDACGGMPTGIGKVVMGGPMMGLPLFDLETPITKTSSGILLIDAVHAAVAPESNCMRCARCSGACPIRLLPMMIDRHARKDDWAQCEELHAMDCIECGACSYVCPARRQLVQSIRVAKREIAKHRAAHKG